MRYRVYYQQDGSCTDEDFCICYANSETEAVEVFHKYHPDDVVDHVERRTGLYDMSKEGENRLALRYSAYRARMFILLRVVHLSSAGT